MSEDARAPAAFELAAGADRVVVDPAHGGRLASLVAGGAERLLPAAAATQAPRIGWGSFLMVPWAGRLAASTVPWQGVAHPIPATFGRHAIHGVGLDAPWALLDRGEQHAQLACRLADGGWPLGGTAEQRIELAPGHLTLAATVTAGERSMPAAVGWHPWFQRPGVGDVALTVDADQVLVTDDELIPDGRLAPVEGELDLRHGPALGDRRLDHAYVGVRGPARVVWPDLALQLEINVADPCYVVHTPAHGVCVEPQSAWPNAPALGHRGASGLAHLAPGRSLHVRCTWSWTTPTSKLLAE